MFPEIQDTIIAASTPSGKSLCAIIRISGAEALYCIKDFFVSQSNIDLELVPSYSSVKGHIHLTDEGVQIPVSLYVMRRPHSYTKEDVVEIHTIGSPVLVEMLLSFMVSKNIQAKRNLRLSEPGEFTKRAFLNGRIDLAQAEAVMRIIRARTDRELNIAVAHLTGDISLKIRSVLDDMISLCASVEAAIDFSDQDIELISTAEVMDGLKAAGMKLSGLLAQPETAKIPSEGIMTVLYGKPNVGKSSLINALLGRKRSIICDMPGTTRDIITDTLKIDTLCFHLTDTAGVDDTNDIMVSMAMKNTRFVLKRAEIILLVLDCSVDISVQLEGLEEFPGKVIIVINKCDIREKRSCIELPERFRDYPFFYTSALTGEGLGELKEALVSYVLGGKINLAGDSSAITVRQKEALQHSLQSVELTVESVQGNEGFEFIALNLRTAIDALGEIIGEVTTEDILGKIFSEFCIGK
ncbi:MAG: tRNA uridine-5-carboxymethylaminomethyl(34) synthesis GTPase MnmE [Candidatus Loosdrechtia sp.]|uniref:tRNA modification GTPase n=1 Tax=Candidatus Loosdrechtia sp. TaxID=3101272 RepID=UPI003A642169|nr:MAG: tRNA uridine-5-carboxymethylaminomethyl(34) synthesis GTPase MnmE [Candidatus Jettenia sp. AMX2]